MNLQEPYLPEGFDAFWEDTVREANIADLDFERRPQQEVTCEGFEIDLIDFKGVNGATVHGWFACDEEALMAPSFLWLAPYGRWSMMPNEYGTRKGMCSLGFNYFGESAFHRETYKPERGYFTDGLDSPETWVFRRMFQDSVIAARVMVELEETNSQRIGVAGMSQGAGIAVWLGAFCTQIKAVCADMPFGAARPLVFADEMKRYPLKELEDWWAGDNAKREQAMRTMSFFDTVNLAAKCDVPTLLTWGSKDPAVREFEVQSIFNALSGERKIDEIDGGHDWHESMIDRNQEWFLEHL